MSFESPCRLQRVGIGNINYQEPVSDSSSGNLPGVTIPMVSFAVGDGQDGVPVDGATFIKATTLCGQNIVDKQLGVCREGIWFLWNSAVQVMQMRRFNSGGLGGWTFEAGQLFVGGERYNVFILGINNTVET